MLTGLRLALIRMLWPIWWDVGCSLHIEGERCSRTVVRNGLEYTLVIQPEGNTIYGREGVFRLLKIVRENEARMGWICPEPDVNRSESNEDYWLRLALSEAIRMRSEYERTVMKYTSDSWMVASWRQLLAKRTPVAR